MASAQDIDSWAANEGLSRDITSVLKQQGFNCLNDIRILSPEDIKECFQDTQLLKPAQCLALKKAVAKLTHTAITTTTTTITSPPPISLQNLYHVLPSEPSPFHPHPIHPQHSPRGAYPGAPLPTTTLTRSTGSVGLTQSPHLCGLSGGCGPRHLESASYVDGAAATSRAGRTNDVTPDGNDECFRLLLLGKTGSGKSTTGNTILGERLFDTAATFSSVTADCERQTSHRGGRKIEIIDSPGLYDTHKTHEEICVLIVQAVAGMHPGPHAILYVVRLGRYTAEEYAAYRRLKALFDETISRYLIVVFTHGDMLEREHKSITDLIGTNAPQTLHQVLRECNNRYIVFNNVAPDPQPQVERLLQMVRQMVAYNGDKPYSCPKYFSIGEGMEEEVTRRLQEVEKRDLQRQKYVQQLEQQTQEAEEAARRTLEQFEKNEEERQRRMEEEEDRRRQLEEQLQTHIREQQIGFEHYQEELQRLHKEREAQERTMKEKEAEMTEKERRRAEEETQRMRQREQELAALMEKQEERLRRQREEDEERRHRLERERQEFMQQMEEQRRKDREEVERRDEERERLWEQHREEERQAAEEREENYENEMEKLKGQIVAKENTNFINTCASVISGVVIPILRFILRI